MDSYTINNIAVYRNLDWKLSNEFLYLTEIPTIFEPFVIHPNYYSFGIINKGSMTLQIDNDVHIITPTSFMIYRPEQTLKIIEIESGTEGAFILFTRRFIQDFHPILDAFFTNTFLHNHFGSHIIMVFEDHQHLSILFSKIFDVLSAIYTERWETSARNLIITLINETDIILKKYQGSVLSISTKENLIISKFKSLAKEHFSTQKPITFYSDQLNISISRLYKIFKKQNLMPPSSYLNELLLQEAKFLLANSENNVGEIAARLSFSDIHTFSRFFKKHTTFSPTAFRLNEIKWTEKDKN